MGWWFGDVWQSSPTLALCWVAWVIISITLHELGHGWMAIRCGDGTPAYTGHMTLNPLVHIPFPWAWIMFAAFGFTWGLMPVNPSNFRGRYDDAKVAFAGPAVNAILAVLCAIMSVIWVTYARGAGPAFPIIAIFLYCGVMINTVGFLFNLIPVPPLDGSRILGDFFPALRPFFRGERAVWVSVVAALVLFRYGGDVVWPAARHITELMLDTGLRLTGGGKYAP